LGGGLDSPPRPGRRAHPRDGGRGEGVRIALFTAGIKFEDEHMGFEEYQAKKGKTDDHAWKNGLPVLTVDDKSYSQSLAMLRYAGKKAGLYPKDDIEALLVDEIMDLTQDILTKTPQDDDEDVKIAKRKEYADGKMAALFDLLEQRAAEAGTGFIAGADLTVADLCLYVLLKLFRDGMFDHVDPKYPDRWPKVVDLEQRILKHKVLVDYYASKA